MTLAVHLQPLLDKATMRPVHECVLCLTGVEASTKQTRIEFKSDPSTRKRDVKKHDLKILPCKETWLTKGRKCIAAILTKKKGSVSRNYVKVSLFSKRGQQSNCARPPFTCLHLNCRVSHQVPAALQSYKMWFSPLWRFQNLSNVQILMSSAVLKKFSISPCLIPLLGYSLVEF